MKLMYVGPRDEIVLHDIGVVKRAEAFECSPTVGAYLIKRFNVKGEAELFIEPPVVESNPIEMKPHAANVSEKYVSKTGKKISL